MKKSTVFLIVIVGLVFGIAAIPLVSTMINSTAGLTTPKANATELGEDERRALSVEVARVEAGPIETAIDYSGNVKSVDEVVVLPKASGRIESVNVEEGDHVGKGDILAVLESDTLKAQVDQASAALQVAEIQIQQMQDGGRVEQIAAAQAAVDAAQAQLDRVRLPLNENEQAVAKSAEVQAKAALKAAQAAYDQIAWYDGKGMLPQSVALEQATIGYEAAHAQYEEALSGAKPEDIRAAQAMVDQAKAQLALARNPYRDTDLALAAAQYLQAKAAFDLMELQLKETIIRSPMEGVVAAAPMSVGSMAGPTTPMATIVSSDVEVIVKVEESRIGEIKTGQPTSISVAAFPDQKFTGEVSLVSPTANDSDRTFEVKITPDQQDSLLRAGMFAEVNLTTEQYANALLVPASAVVTEGNESYVYVVDNGEVAKRIVTTGLVNKDSVQIQSGLTLGEQVVLSGQKSLNPGDWVNVVSG